MLLFYWAASNSATFTLSSYTNKSCRGEILQVYNAHKNVAHIEHGNPWQIVEIIYHEESEESLWQSLKHWRCSCAVITHTFNNKNDYFDFWYWFVPLQKCIFCCIYIPSSNEIERNAGAIPKPQSIQIVVRENDWEFWQLIKSLWSLVALSLSVEVI